MAEINSRGQRVPFQISGHTAAQLKNLRVDEATFQAMKRCLNSLRPSPVPKVVAK